MELLIYDNFISGNLIDGDDVIRGEEKHMIGFSFN